MTLICWCVRDRPFYPLNRALTGRLVDALDQIKLSRDFAW
jgi:hypothetical protein